MLDLSNITYRLVILSETGEQYNIRDYVTNLGWEENEKELAQRISFTVKNGSTASGVLSSLAKAGCLAGVFASDGNREEEVARGFIVKWNPKESLRAKTLECQCYDELYSLQQSQDNIYYSPGVGTQSVITQILDDWEIPLETYAGPDVAHGKLAYKSESLSDVILDVLDDAEKKGGGKYFIRASRGKISILPYGSNKTVYCFEADNTKVVSHSLSTAGMVTRVKIIGQADDEGRSSVEAVRSGQTRYGIRQKIYTREKDGSLEEAVTAAQTILDEKGDLEEEITVQAPDIPWLRKGDLVYVREAAMDSYYYVAGIRHDADEAAMTMDLKKAETKTVSEEGAVRTRTHQEGDVVNFRGGTHYVSSYPGAKGYPAGPGQAKITKANGSGGAHPWHLIHCGSGSNVYGWVDDGTFD